MTRLIKSIGSDEAPTSGGPGCRRRGFQSPETRRPIREKVPQQSNPPATSAEPGPTIEPEGINWLIDWLIDWLLLLLLLLFVGSGLGEEAKEWEYQTDPINGRSAPWMDAYKMETGRFLGRFLFAPLSRPSSIMFVSVEERDSHLSEWLAHVSTLKQIDAINQTKRTTRKQRKLSCSESTPNRW